MLLYSAAKYDSLMDAGQEPPSPCPVCTGDDDAEPCSEDCAELIFRADRLKAWREQLDQLIPYLFRAKLLVQRYREEDGPGGAREREACIEIERFEATRYVLDALIKSGGVHVTIDVEEAA